MALRVVDVQPTWSDVQVSDAVSAFLEASPEEQARQVHELHHAERARVDAMLVAAVRASPAALDFLARLRAICAAATKDSSADLGMLDDALTGVLHLLYGPAMTRLHQLSISSGACAEVARLTHTARATEVVHRTDSDAAFARKFGARRVVHALAHCASPAGLLAVLYSAFLPRMPASMAEIDAWSGGGAAAAQRAPGAGGAPAALVAAAAREAAMMEAGGGGGSAPVPPATTVAFYSVSSAPDMRGLRLGRRIIYEVATLIAAACPEIKTFVTLSPIPGFAAWLRSPAGTAALGDDSALPAEEARQGIAAAAAAQQVPTASSAQLLRHLLADGSWYANDSARDALQPVLMRLCAQYLTTSSGRHGAPLCPVAAFHLGNGARMGRLCWAADPSPAGLARSAGIMVNYVYAEDGDLSHAMRGRALAYETSPHAVLAEQAPEWVDVRAGGFRQQQ
jgi:hypothetical protein